MPADLVPVRRALLSVSDKTGLAEFASALVKEFNIELISTGGTAKFLRDLGLKVKDVSEVTGFPEMMDGRVKTLHPKIHGGLLALRDNPEHAAAMKQHDIQPIDLVVINLYPFQQTIAKPNVTFEEAIENIDIGGPSMIRSAAKNHRFVLVVTSPDRYEKVLGDLREHKGSSCGKHRLKQAQRAFAHTAAYDAVIVEYLQEYIDSSTPLGATGGGPARFAHEPHAGRIALATADEPPKPDRTSRLPLGNRIFQRLRAARDLPAFLTELLTAQAVSVVGTEAAAFVLQDSRLQLVVHIRPDESSPEIRQAAVKAFEELIRPCVAQGRDGAIEIETPQGENVDPQYCLVTLLFDEDRIAGASAVISRCKNSQESRERLTRMQQLAGYLELYTLRRRRAELEQQLDESSDEIGSQNESSSSTLPQKLKLKLTKEMNLRYGENPHQNASLYVAGKTTEASVANAKQLHGKELSYINLLDADAALSAVKELSTPTVCIVKHATPCGFATAGDLPTAFRNAFAGDPLAAFGGIVALNKAVDRATAEAITSIDKLLEVIVAPSYDADALDLLRTRWKNVRLLEVGPIGGFDRNELSMHKIVGGYLVQERDLTGLNESDWQVVSSRKPTDRELQDLRVAWLACKHVKSNAIVLAKDQMMLGSGAGQQDRVNACRIAIQKAGDRVKGAVAASDAFFPFPDGPQLLLNAGVTAIIHPGGSVKDQETIDLVNVRGAAMIVSGQRHFRH